MKTRLTRAALPAVTFLLTNPPGLLAHAGHAGDHGLLAGAAQPLLSPGHFVGAVLVLAIVAVGASVIVRLFQRQGVTSRCH